MTTSTVPTSTLRFSLAQINGKGNDIEAALREYKVSLAPGEPRRNVVTRDVPLNHLVGRDFMIGGVTVHGIRLCEPCSHLEGLTGSPVIKALRHRGGLRAQILTQGVIRVGDAVTEPIS